MAIVGTQPASIQCPNCRTQFQTTIFSLIDVGKHPELKNYFLSGRINLAVCPSCGAGGMLATPLVYHDPDKQLFLALMPQELKLKPEEIERFIGDITRAIMADSSAGGAKGYLLTPKRFISPQSLIDTILEADGITKEALAAQRRRVELIELLADAFEEDLQTPGSARLTELAEQRKEELDYDFFMVLTALMEASAKEGQQQSIALLEELRARLIEISGFDAVEAGLEDPDQGELEQEELLTTIIEAPDEQLEELLAEHRPALDYSFYQKWATRIQEAEQAGDEEGAERLAIRRLQIVELAERLDHEAQEMFEAAAGVLREVASEPDLEQALRERREQIDEAFMLVLDASIAAAERAGQQERAEQLIALQQLAIKIVQETMTPQDRLINEMLLAEKDQDARQLLRTNMAMLTPDFIKQINELVEQMDKAGRKEDAERLRQVSREAASLLF